MLNRRIKEFNESSTNVINLSSKNISKLQMYVLELGHGFVPTPTNKQKEEEILILEGLRVTDRICKLDRKITASNDREESTEVSDTEAVQQQMSNTLDETFHGFSDSEHTFERPKNIPQFLKYSQPKEGQLNNPVTKKMQKEFDEFNNKLISRATKVKKNGSTSQRNFEMQ